MHDTVTHINLTDSWIKYNNARVAGDKKAANKLLADYIVFLKKQDSSTIESFVDEVCSSTLDNDNQVISNNGTEVSDRATRIQHPLFNEIILPVLTDKYKSNSPRHIKWIGQLEQFFYNDYSTTTNFLNQLNINGHFETRFFFEKSFSLDNKQNTLTLLLTRIAQDINFYTHEVPIGVTVEPDFLDQELMVFNKYWELSDNKHLWDNKLKEWKLIARHWRIYLDSQNQYDSFKNYLQKNEIQLD
jgi:hypothetical protein